MSVGSSSLSGFPGNYFGFRNGRLFGEVAPYVDTTKAPGMSVLPAPTVYTWIRGAPSLLLTSPNAIWYAFAMAVYLLAPYDLSPTGHAFASPVSYAFFSERFPIWLCLTLGYTSFWHITLHGLGWATRPFIQNRPYNLDKVAHNIAWSVSGIAIWTCFENVITFLWATHRLPYLSNTESLTTSHGLLMFGLTSALIPVWRDVHFYVAHRLLHWRPLYIQVHSLHHRNTDIEPFSGLCMHPVEHLYYFSCIAPSLLLTCSPFAFVWNGAHLLLSPGASHSGYEDHFQADAHHYMHHRYFECNYAGFGASFLDTMMGTFVDTMAIRDKDGVTLRGDAKSTLRTVPTKEFCGYLLGSAGCMLPWLLSVNQMGPLVPAVLAGFGPVGAAVLLTSVVGGSSGTPFRLDLSSCLHFLVGILFCSVPITYALYLTRV